MLSNGRYAVMVTTAGSGYSHWRDIAVTRWREDATMDPWGSYLYVRDTRHGAVWSAGYQPAGREADTYEVSYSEDRASSPGATDRSRPRLTVLVSAEDDAEIRRVSLTNLGSRARRDRAHVVPRARTGTAGGRCRPSGIPEAVRADRVRRRDRRAARDPPAALATTRSGCGRRTWRSSRITPTASIQYETDRARFLGRGRSVRSAASVVEGRPLSNSVGAVLDPIFSLRRPVVIEPGETVHAIFATVLAETREQVIDLADKYRTPATFERARVLAWTHAQVQLHHLGIDAAEAHLFQRLANRILYSDPSLRPPPNVLAENTTGRPDSGPTASRATCRSSSFASTSSRTSTSSASCCGPTSTGASSGSTSIS